MSSFTFCTYLILVFFSIGYGFLERSLVLQITHLVNSFLDSPNRIKRDDYACPQTCVTSIKSNINTNAELNHLMQALNSTSITVIQMPKSEFQKFCQSIVNPALSCVDKCYSSSMMPTILRKTMVPLKFLCRDYYDEMITNYDCLSSAENVTKAKCINGVCKDMNQAPEKLLQISKTNAPLYQEDFDRFKKLLADTCEYYTCIMHCEKPIVATMCNERIARLTKNDFIGIAMQTSKEFFVVDNVEKYMWPAQCQKILVETGYGSASKTAGIFPLVSLLLVMLVKLY